MRRREFIKSTGRKAHQPTIECRFIKGYRDCQRSEVSGTMSALTTEKTNLVGAINELRTALLSLIDDTAVAGNVTHTY